MTCCYKFHLLTPAAGRLFGYTEIEARGIDLLEFLLMEEKGVVDLDDPLSCADEALYQSKENGRDRTTVWNESD